MRKDFASGSEPTNKTSMVAPNPQICYFSEEALLQSDDKMISDREIAEFIFRICLESGHKPGKVQFTKYLYQLDYCYWRYTGKQATTFPWKFYHYGPWCQPVEDCMSYLAQLYNFYWREEEESIVKSVQVAVVSVPMLISGIGSNIVQYFKDKDLTDLLEVTYSQTEPMIAAKRGDLLNFRSIPVTKDMPQYLVQPAQPKPYVIHPERQKQIDEYKRGLELRKDRIMAQAKETEALRKTPEYARAMELMAKDMMDEEGLPQISIELTPEAVEGLYSNG